MKKIVSVSLGSSRRDHTARIELLGEEVVIQRLGTDGDMSKAIQLVRDLDGKVDAFGMGGIDLYLWVGRKRYIMNDALKIARAARRTPMLDGTRLRDTLERRVVEYMRTEAGIPLNGAKVLVVSVVGHFGAAEGFIESGCKMLFGDVGFALGAEVPLYSLASVKLLAALIIPVVSRLPFKMVYPIGEAQEKTTPRFKRWYEWADIITGDCHYIKRHMPDDLTGKVVVTNTVTAEDLEAFRARKVSTLLTTTPEVQGRSFGANVMEALVVAFLGKRPDEVTPGDYSSMLDRMGFKPRVERLTPA